MKSGDIRWKQRLEHYQSALSQLEKFIDKKRNDGLNELEEQGLIKAFEYTYELAWNTIKDYQQEQGGGEPIHGSRDAFRWAFQNGIVEHGQVWMDMIQSRMLTVHTYNQETAASIAGDILEIYYPQFVALKDTFEQLGRKDG